MSAQQARRVPPAAPAGPGPAATAAGSPPGLMLRLAVMTYEAVLLFGVVFVTGYGLLALTGWTYPLAPLRRWVLQGLLFLAVGAYFVYCWTRAGQTLAMKSWRLRVVDRGGGRLKPGRAIVRYLLAWSLFAPGLAFAVLAGAGAVANLTALLAGVLLMLAAARLDPDGRLLHDRILGTRIVRD